jgi:1-acyl-sn-glycerol-3-phosphate acyltransferase
MWLYHVGKLVVRIVFFFTFRIRAAGKENIPKDGGAILAVNHRSNWDVIVAGLTCPRTLRFMAKAELFENKLFGTLIKHLGAFPVHRGQGDIGAIRAALKKLREHHVMLMFPEGHRMRRQGRVKAKPGVAMLAIQAKVPVIPVYLSGEYKWMHRITARYGEPITFEEYYGKKPEPETLQNLSDGILDSIYQLGEEC